MSDAQPPTTVTFSRFYPHKFVADVDADTGTEQTINLQITRFAVEQGKTFQAEWARIIDPPSGRSIFRKPDGDEQVTKVVMDDKTSKEVFVVDDEEIRRRRISEMTEADAERFLRMEAQDQAFEYDFLARAVTEHVRVAPGQRVLFDAEDGAEPIDVKTGADLVRVFGGQRVKLLELGTAVWAENTLTAAEKKTWRRLCDLKRFLSARQLAAIGKKPDASVGPADNGDSASAADATVASATSPSGSIAT